MRNIERRLFYSLFKFSKIKENNITFYCKSNSGSNTFSLYRFAPESIKNDYNLIIYRKTNASFKSMIKNRDIKSIKKFTKNFSHLFSSKILLTTHGPLVFAKRKKIITVELWHGFPLKTMGLLDNNEVNKENTIKIWKNIDYIISYSTMYNTLMIACMGITIDKFVITGMPRNDFLFKSNGKENLKKIFDIKNKRVIFFMPTFRKGYEGRNDGNKNFNNIFGFENFNEKEFLKFLDSNDIFFVAKLHPNEERFFSDKIISKDNFCLLKNEDLEKNNMDLYELINGVDMMITDYSSIYFDYLLLNRPIIFTPVDLEDYRKNRGLLLEPYDFWTPGLKASTQKDLQNFILRSFEKDDYKDKRNELKDVIHYYQDGESSRRVWNFIQNILEDRK